MRHEDVQKALASAEFFTEWVLVQVAALPPPWTFVVVAGSLVGAFLLGWWWA